MDRQSTFELAADEFQRPTVLDGAQFVVVELAGDPYAIPLGFVHEVEQIPNIAPVPDSAIWVEGVVNLRGTILTVIDVASLLELGPWFRGPSARMLVVGDDDPVALAVDRLRGMRRLLNPLDNAIGANLAGRAAKYSLGIYREGDELLSVLNIPALLQDADRDERSGAAQAGVHVFDVQPGTYGKGA